MSAVLDARPRPGGLEWLPVIAGLLALYVPTFYDVARALWPQDEYAHGPIVLAVIAWLFWAKRQVLIAPPARTAPLTGFTLLVLGLMVYGVGRSQGITSFQVG